MDEVARNALIFTYAGRVTRVTLAQNQWAQGRPLTGRKDLTLLRSGLRVKSLFDLFDHLAHARRHRTIRLQSQICLIFLKRLWGVPFP